MKSSVCKNYREAITENYDVIGYKNERENYSVINVNEIIQTDQVNKHLSHGKTYLHYLSNGYCLGNDIGDMYKLLRAGANVNARDYDGNTPLHLVTQGNEETLDLLVKWGADINAKNKEGNTPLHFAMIVDHDGSETDKQSRRDEIAYKLIELGADVNAKNNEGRTPFYYVNSYHVAEALLNAGTDITSKDNEGLTIIDMLDTFEDEVREAFPDEYFK